MTPGSAIALATDWATGLAERIVVLLQYTALKVLLIDEISDLLWWVLC